MTEVESEWDIIIKDSDKISRDILERTLGERVQSYHFSKGIPVIEDEDQEDAVRKALRSLLPPIELREKIKDLQQPLSDHAHLRFSNGTIVYVTDPKWENIDNLYPDDPEMFKYLQRYSLTSYVVDLRRVTLSFGKEAAPLLTGSLLTSLKRSRIPPDFV